MAPKTTPIIKIDFSRTPEENIDDIYPISDASMSNSLTENWTAAKVRGVNAQHGLYTDIPMMCKGRRGEKECICPSAEYCVIPENVVENKFKYRSCPLEVTEAFKLFAGYVNDLDIQPDDFTDLQTVVDLVRLHLQMRRCDLYQKDKPIYDLKSGAVVQKTGEVKRDKIINLGFAMAKDIRADISKKYEQLIASRKEKVKRDSTVGQMMSDASNIFAKIQSAGAKALKDAAVLELPESTDAEIIE